MPTIKRADGTTESFLPQAVVDVLGKVLIVSGIVTFAAFGYLLFGLFSGQLAATATSKDAQAHALQLVQSTGNVLNISLVATLLCAALLYYEEEAFGLILCIVAAFLAFGLNFLFDFIGSGANLTASEAAKATLKEIHLCAWAIGAVGILMFLWSLIQRIRDMMSGPDLTAITYGKNAKQEEVSRALIPVLAKCWQLPFCREGIRVKCPIYHARTKCWKQRVGCMCEENVLRLAVGGEDTNKAIDMTKEGGFVPIGDIISKSEQTLRTSIPTKVGPRGVRIPTNPHLTDRQKRQRCHNCVIYNEHQRQKYAFFSPLITISVPLLVALNFENIKDLLGKALYSLDALMAHINFSHANAKVTHSELSMTVNGSLPITALLIVIITIVAMTWALRTLEYCVFKIKI